MSSDEDGDAQHLWIFGYGSLMWRPAFSFVQRARASVAGFHRGFCIYSTHHRGTEERPGLVLGLDRGGACEGIAYRVAGSERAATLAYLRERELIYGVYRETFMPIRLLEGRRAAARGIAYTVERSHPSYAGRLAIIRQAQIIRGASGRSGTNLAYLMSTVRHLHELGICEPALERLMSVTGVRVCTSTGLHGPADSADGLYRACRRMPLELPRLRPFERRRFMHRARP